MEDASIVLHSNVWDGVNGLRRDHWITVSEGEIVDVSPTRPSSSGAVYDVEFLTPGLVDMHVHLV
jgi:imidazolonepropionase-like amidohydrolase